MKSLVIVLVLILTGCGGSEPKQSEPEPVAPQPAPEITTGLYEYRLTSNIGGSHSGRGVRSGDFIYFYPLSIANGGNTATAEIEILGGGQYHIRVYSFMTRQVMRDEVVEIGESFELERVGDHEIQSIELLTGQWESRVYFSEPLVTLVTL